MSDEEMGEIPLNLPFKPEFQVAPNPKPTKKPHGNNGPNFLHKLVGKKVILGSNGDPWEVILVGYNRYELLTKDAEGHKIIMKHAIDFIAPAEGEEDPFEPKEKVEENT